MSENNTNVPKIRFPGFTDAWEQRKIVDNVEEVLDYRGKSPTKFGMEWGNEGYLVLSALNVKDGYIDKSIEAKYGDQELFEIWMGERRLEKGDVLFTTEAPLGNVAQVPDDDGYILNQRAVAFKTNSRKTSNNFLAQLLRSPLVQERLNANASGGTAKGIGMKEFGKLTAYVATQVEEQNKIGAFFSNLNYLISLHQRKLNHLQDKKKSLLQKMFPKNGANVPEIRFPGFTHAWEQRKLQDVANVMDGDRGKNYPSGNDFSEQGHTLFLSATNVTKDGFSFESNQYITEEKSNSLGNGKLELNDIVLTSRGSLGHVAWYNNDIRSLVPFARINSGMLILRSKQDVEPGYIAQYLKSPFGKGQIDLISFGSAQPQLTKKDVSNYKLSIPKKAEQAQIGRFFSHLDHLITLHQRKLNHLQEQKKALLQQMFV